MFPFIKKFLIANGSKNLGKLTTCHVASDKKTFFQPPLFVAQDMFNEKKNDEKYIRDLEYVH